MKTLPFCLCCLAALALVGGCAHGPAVVEPPTVRVSTLRPTVTTPELMKFEARIIIDNRMSDSLDFARVDYAVDLYDQELFTSSFDGLKRTRGHGRQTVTFPFQIAMEDILAQATHLLAEGNVRVGFRGVVYPGAASGFGPLPFQDTVEIPIPKLPEIVFAGTEGVPFGEQFTIRVRVRNTNAFPMSVHAVDSYLELNGQRYTLLHTVQATEIASGASAVVALHMENTPGKTLSMALNALQSSTSSYVLAGSVTCDTPYGWVYVPLRIEGQL